MWLIVEENEAESSTFAAGANSLAPYLAGTLLKQGAYLQNYYATGHVSLDNYIAMISGQPASPQTTSDCQIGFNNFTVLTTDASTGVVAGDGCVYPAPVKNLGDQLSAAGVSWRSYDEDMGNDAVRDSTTVTPFACGHPNPTGGTVAGTGQSDPTQSEEAADAYATRHNPFMYFHSTIDVTTGANACANHVVNLQRNLTNDLASLATTPQFSFITPNLCDDGHDTNCATGGVGGLPGLDAYLKNTLIPAIQGSAAYNKDGLIVITFDEGASTDTSSCCSESGQIPGTPTNGGGVIGAVLLSPFIKGPVVDTTPYNHYSLLKYLETTFGITAPTNNGTPFLGYATRATAFAATNFNNTTTTGMRRTR